MIKRCIQVLLITLVILTVKAVPVSAQYGTTGTEREYVGMVFTGQQLINSQTTTMPQTGSWWFGIQHRFGRVGVDSSLVEQFLGLDLPSVVRFSFGWALSDRLSFEIGRTNHLKTYNLEAKYLIARQTSDFKMPVSIAAYMNTAIRTERFPNIPPDAYFEDDVTPFAYKASHRLTYNTQLILSSRVSENLSLLLNPIFIYENLAEPYTDNFTMAISGGFRYKLGFASSLIGEYAHVVNNRGTEFYNPFSVGVEFGTAGHTFQVFVSSASKILESQIYTTSGLNLAEGEFLIGFNLIRTFWKKNKN